MRRAGVLLFLIALAVGGTPTAASGAGAPTPTHPPRLQHLSMVLSGEPLARVLPRTGGARPLDPSTAAALVDELDDAFIGRVDIYALLLSGSRVDLWLTDANRLCAARLQAPSGRRVFAARTRGCKGAFFDERGFSLDGPLLARPLKLARVTSRFGARFDPITGAARIHYGIDYGAPVGTPVRAIGDAEVVALGEDKSAGRYVKLRHRGGFESLYLHLSDVEPGLLLGARVRRGDVIAWTGNTGRSTGPHLHYELRLDGEPLDPSRTIPLPSAALGTLERATHQRFMNALLTSRAPKGDESQ